MICNINISLLTSVSHYDLKVCSEESTQSRNIPFHPVMTGLQILITSCFPFSRQNISSVACFGLCSTNTTSLSFRKVPRWTGCMTTCPHPWKAEYKYTCVSFCCVLGCSLCKFPKYNMNHEAKTQHQNTTLWFYSVFFVLNAGQHMHTYISWMSHSQHKPWHHSSLCLKFNMSKRGGRNI